MSKAQKTVIKIVSGGQTGVDRAALDVALKLGIPCGGWCLKGRAAEDGTISTRYPLFQISSDDPFEVIERNVQDSEATLVLTLGRPKAGAAFTIETALREERPCLVVDLTVPVSRRAARFWITRHEVHTLNVSGPLATQHPEAYDLAAVFLEDMLRDD